MTKWMCHHGILFIIHATLVKLSFHAKKNQKDCRFQNILGKSGEPTVECKL